MDESKAREVLRLSPDAGPDEAIAAFYRLAKRYPAGQFPERYAQLMHAREALESVEGTEPYLAIIRSRDIDFSDIAESMQKAGALSIQIPPARELSEELVRQAWRLYCSD